MNSVDQKPGSLKWIVVILLCLGVVVGGFFIFSKRGQEAEVYKEVKVSRGDLTVSILATGTIQPENRLEIKPPVAGRVDSVLVKEGQRVRKGQILIWMSSTERAALLDAARSKGEEEVKNWQEIYKATPVIAPISGTIIHRNIEPGQSFSGNDAVLVMSDRLTVKAQVDETDIASIKLKQNAQIVLDAYPKEKFDGHVDQIAFEAKTVNNVTNYIVDVLPEKTPEFMRSGMTANVNFVLNRKENILLIATDAIKVRKDKSTVLVKESNGSMVEREIETGITDGKKTEILRGLNEGEAVFALQVNLKGKTQGTNPFMPTGPRPKKPGK